MVDHGRPCFVKWPPMVDHGLINTMSNHGPGPWLTMVKDHGLPWFKITGKEQKSKIQFKTKVAFSSWDAIIDMQILFHTMPM